MTISFRQGIPSDAAAISNLVVASATTFYIDPEGRNAEGFLASVTEESERSYLEDERFWFLLAEEHDELLGFIGVRDRSHIFHLFVTPACQKQGLGTALIQKALEQINTASTTDAVTVNASLKAQDFYRRHGFIATDTEQQSNGVQYLPMQKLLGK